MKNSKINKALVVGTGTMGPGIAQSFAQAGIDVDLFGRNPDQLPQAVEIIRQNLEAFVTHQLISSQQAQEILARVRLQTDLAAACDGTDFVIEAVPESLEIKCAVFSELDRLCPRSAILASNTSGLSITALSAATDRPDLVVGAHYWNPAHLMPLVEVVRGERTSDETMTETVNLMTRLGKKPVRVEKEIWGFIGTRLHQALIREAFYLLEEGVATIQDVDAVVKYSFGRRLPITGPFETCDLGGLDVFLAASESWAELSNEAGPSALLVQKVTQGDLGGKTGKGLYAWDSDKLKLLMENREAELIRYLIQDKKEN